MLADHVGDRFLVGIVAVLVFSLTVKLKNEKAALRETAIKEAAIKEANLFYWSELNKIEANIPQFMSNEEFERRYISLFDSRKWDSGIDAIRKHASEVDSTADSISELPALHVDDILLRYATSRTAILRKAAILAEKDADILNEAKNKTFGWKAIVEGSCGRSGMV